MVVHPFWASLRSRRSASGFPFGNLMLVITGVLSRRINNRSTPWASLRRTATAHCSAEYTHHDTVDRAVFCTFASPLPGFIPLEKKMGLVSVTVLWCLFLCQLTTPHITKHATFASEKSGPMRQNGWVYRKFFPSYLAFLDVPCYPTYRPLAWYAARIRSPYLEFMRAAFLSVASRRQKPLSAD
jgi:hypothetical protein